MRFERQIKMPTALFLIVYTFIFFVFIPLPAHQLHSMLREYRNTAFFA